MVIVLLLLSVCTMVIVVANAHNLSAQMSTNELLSMQQLLRDQHLHYLTQRSAAEAVNRRYHDLKHVLTQIERIAEDRGAEGLDDLRAFAGSLNREIEPFILDVRTGNGVLDVLLTEKRRQCLGAGIRPTFFVDGSRLGFINDFDLCTLIGNAADNAIEATSQLPLGEARESSWCPCRPRLESARGSELPRALPLEARVHLMARRVVGGSGGEHGLLGCRSLRPINFTPSSCRSRLKKARHFAIIRVRRSPAATGGCFT